jgi:hypothetical protein
MKVFLALAGAETAVIAETLLYPPRDDISKALAVIILLSIAMGMMWWVCRSRK